MKPIAINAAGILGADPRGFCVAVLIACSASFLMPIGHPAMLFVQEPGDYRGDDYLRFGLGLALITLATIIAMIPLLWPF